MHHLNFKKWHHQSFRNIIRLNTELHWENWSEEENGYTTDHTTDKKPY